MKNVLFFLLLPASPLCVFLLILTPRFQQRKLPRKKPLKMSAKSPVGKSKRGRKEGGRGAPRGVRPKTLLRHQRAKAAVDILHGDCLEVNPLHKKKKPLSPQEQMAVTKKRIHVRTAYYESHGRTPTERTRMLVDSTTVRISYLALFY